LGELKENPLTFYRALNQNFGDIASYKIGPIRIFQFTHPDQIFEILVEKQKYFQKTKPVRRVLSKWNGNGLLLNSGKSWARQRRLIGPSFSPNSVNNYISIVTKQTHALFSNLPQEGLDLEEKLNELTFRVVAESLFGSEVNSSVPRFIKEINVLQDLAMKEMMSPVPLPDWLPIPSKVRLTKIIKFIHKTVNHFISEAHLKGLKNNNLLTAMLKANDNEEENIHKTGMTDQQARDESVNLLLGGNETMGTALTWFCYLLSKNPDIQEKVYQEIQNVVGGKDPTAEDLPRLKLLLCSFKETLRLYPPVYILSREPERPIQIGEIKLKPGNQVHLPLFLTHRNEKWFPDPDVFKPERFSEEREKDIHPNTYLPFGLGPRACIGEQFATMEALSAMTLILQKYKLELLKDAKDPELEAKVSLHPKGQIPVRLVPREGS
jgi:cytochrome P450